MPVDEAYATRLKNHLLAEYARGAWDPEAEDGAGLPGDDPTVLEYLRRWAKTLTYESAPEDRERVERYVAPAPFGRMKIRAAKPKDAAAFIEWLKQKPSGRGGVLAPRSVRNIYDVVRRGHDAATFDELLPANPFTAVKGRLPAIADKDPTAREGWHFDHAEIVQLLTDPRVPADRRIAYAVLFLTGARFGEMTAMRWRDWDATRTPLQRITITRAIKSVSKKEGATKTGARKLVPVHPVLQELLEAWRDVGWAEHQGHAHGPDDLMFPNQNGGVRDVSRGNRDFKRDLVKLTLRERHQYVTRHAFITMAQDDGGDPSVLKWITHAPPRSAFDGYTREQWDKLCREIAKIKVKLTPSASAPSDPPTPPEEPTTGDPPTGGGASEQHMESVGDRAEYPGDRQAIAPGGVRIGQLGLPSPREITTDSDRFGSPGLLQILSPRQPKDPAIQADSGVFLFVPRGGPARFGRGVRYDHRARSPGSPSLEETCTFPSGFVVPSWSAPAASPRLRRSRASWARAPRFRRSWSTEASRRSTPAGSTPAGSTPVRPPGPRAAETSTARRASDGTA